MIVVFDANIWISHLYANAPLRASALLYLQRKSAIVALPEVVKLEVQRHLRQRLCDFRDQAAESYEKLLKVFGKMKEATFPSDQQIDTLMQDFFTSTGFSFREIPLSLESARQSFLRTVEKTPPSHRSQQFKDGVIWADVLRLAEEDDVMFVAADKAFFEDGDPRKGLAILLAEEAKKTPFGVTVLYDIYSFMDAVKEPITFDPQLVIAAAKAEKFWTDIETLCSVHGLAPTETTLTYSAFATEQPNVVALACELNMQCEDATGGSKTQAEAFATFDCLRKEVDGKFDHFAPRSAGIKYIDASGEPVERRNGYLYAEGIVIGQREVTNRFRAPL